MRGGSVEDLRLADLDTARHERLQHGQELLAIMDFERDNRRGSVTLRVDRIRPEIGLREHALYDHFCSHPRHVPRALTAKHSRRRGATHRWIGVHSAADIWGRIGATSRGSSAIRCPCAFVALRFTMWHRSQMTTSPVLRSVDAITIPVPRLDDGLAFYRDRLGHRLLWRNDTVGQAGLALPDCSVEVVLATRQQMEANWLVDSLDTAIRDLLASGARVASEPSTIPVGRVAVVIDPFGNPLVLVELTGRYDTATDTGAHTD
jgi:catechol 2,3-dioxygenase-like lactoylglutathione lyase family enzyme